MKSGHRKGQQSIYPHWLRRLDVYEVEACHERFWGLCEIRRAPTAKDPCREVVWPKGGLAARVIPEGIIPLDSHAGFDHEVIMERFFCKHSKDGIIAWSLEGPHYGSFMGPYNSEMRSWLARNLVFGTICGIAPGVDIVMIADNDLRYSVIGAPHVIIRDFESDFGGDGRVKSEFVRHVEAGDLGAEFSDREWAREYLMRWCGW